MKSAVRAIIVHKGSLLVIRRDKFGTRYYTLPGGHVKYGESNDKALLREIHEETQLHISKPRLTYIDRAPEPYGDQYIYLCEYVEGVPMLHKDSEEYKIGQGGQNMYTPMWLPIHELKTVTFRSTSLKERIIQAFISDFPATVEEFTSTLDA